MSQKEIAELTTEIAVLTRDVRLNNEYLKKNCDRMEAIVLGHEKIFRDSVIPNQTVLLEDRKTSKRWHVGIIAALSILSAKALWGMFE